MSTRERKIILREFVLVISCTIIFSSDSLFADLTTLEIEFFGIEGYKCDIVPVKTKISNKDKTFDVWLESIDDPFPDSSLGDFDPLFEPDVLISKGVTTTVAIGEFHFTSDKVCSVDNEGVRLNFWCDKNNDGKRTIPDEIFDRAGSFSVHVVPAPGALILASMGVGLAGSLTRRRTP